MKRSSVSPIPTQINLVIAGTTITVNAAALLVLPAFGSSVPWMLAATAGAAALLRPTHWALIHEGIHGLLLPGRVANERLARMLAILFGVPFRAVRFAHLRHDRYNRTPWGREEVYDPTTRSRGLPARCNLRITFGLYVCELALSLLCWLPRPVLRARLRAQCPDLRDEAAA